MLTAAAVATMLGLSRRAVYDLADRGILPCFRMGARAQPVQGLRDIGPADVPLTADKLHAIDGALHGFVVLLRLLPLFAPELLPTVEVFVLVVFVLVELELDVDVLVLPRLSPRLSPALAPEFGPTVEVLVVVLVPLPAPELAPTVLVPLPAPEFGPTVVVTGAVVDVVVVVDTGAVVVVTGPVFVVLVVVVTTAPLPLIASNPRTATYPTATAGSVAETMPATLGAMAIAASQPFVGGRNWARSRGST